MSRIRQRGKAGNLNGSPGRARSELPSHLHSDSPKSQHDRNNVANRSSRRRSRPSALASLWLEAHHVRAAAREVLHVF